MVDEDKEETKSESKKEDEEINISKDMIEEAFIRCLIEVIKTYPIEPSELQSKYLS